MRLSLFCTLACVFVATPSASASGSKSTSSASKKSRKGRIIKVAEDPEHDQKEEENPQNELPPIQFALSPARPEFVRMKKMGSWGGLYAANEADGTALRVTTNGWFKKCIDEFHEFAYFEDHMAAQALDAANYKRCQRPRAELDASHYTITPRLSCNLQNYWQRLDCKFEVTEGEHSRTFYASRMDHMRRWHNKPGRALRDLVGLTGSTKKFHDRVRCDAGHRSTEAQMTECKSLLATWVGIEDAFKQLIAQRDAKVQAASAQAKAASPEATAEKEEEAMSTTTIMLIAGGALLGIGGIAVLFKMMNKGDKGDKRRARDHKSGDKRSSQKRSDRRPRKERNRRHHEAEAPLDEQSEIDKHSEVDIEENRPPSEPATPKE